MSDMPFAKLRRTNMFSVGNTFHKDNISLEKFGTGCLKLCCKLHVCRASSC